MEKTIFAQTAHAYDKKAVVQADAFSALVSLAALKGDEAVLDIGCGPGRLLAELRKKTTGHLEGIDPSAAMIELAQQYKIPDSTFRVCKAEDLDVIKQFDVIFCNSAFQWFSNAPSALRACFNALVPGGKMLMQAPGGKEYCPSFVQVERDALHDPSTKEIFARFKTPWLFLNTAEEYGSLFLAAGFVLETCEIANKALDLTVEQCMAVFESGAAEAYLNPAFYNGGFPGNYPQCFRNLIASRIADQKNAQGLVHLDFNRIFIKAIKPA